MPRLANINRALDVELSGNTNCIFFPYKSSNNDNEKWILAHVDAFSELSGLSSRTVTIRLKGTLASSIWLATINDSRDAWNSSGAGVSIYTTTSGSSPHTLEVDSFYWDSAGRCTKYPLGNVVATSSTIEINSRTTGTEINPRRSTVTHEMGHLVWLGDNPPVVAYNDSLMHHYRNRETVFVPKTYDINNVRFKYD